MRARLFGRILLAAAVLTFSSTDSPAKETVLGVALSPAHLPNPSDKDFENFFDEAAQLGSHVIWIVEWESLPELGAFESVRRATRVKGLAFHIFLSPIALTGGRKTPAIPAGVRGRSFGDQTVRNGYRDQALKLAGLEPDFLGLGTEVNALAQNPAEFEPFASMVRETCVAVKQKFPSIKVMTSFQWDLAHATGQTAPLTRFGECFDYYSFTTYPFLPPSGPVYDPSTIAADYYSGIRKLFPTQRVGFSEVGWTSAEPWNEDSQAAFFRRLPELMRPVKADFVTLSLMHDIPFFSGDLAPLNSVGVRHRDGSPKKAWDVVLSLPPSF